MLDYGWSDKHLKLNTEIKIYDLTGPGRMQITQFDKKKIEMLIAKLFKW